MKFNFRKIAAVLAGAVMLGSTIGFAANFPAPFVTSGQADVAVVYGSAATADLTAATTIANDLIGSVTVTGPLTPSGGETYTIEKESNKFNINDDATDIKASLDESELPILLEEGTYQTDDNEEYDYTQEIAFSGNLQMKHFQEDDYAEEPVIGFHIGSSAPVLNYTIDFTDNIKSDVTGGDLVDMETTTLKLLGKNYYVLNVDNATNIKLTLLDSANEVTLEENTPSTVVVGSKSYTISAKILEDTVKLTVNGEITDSLEEDETYKLTDGTYIGVKEIGYNSKESGISSVDISIGSGKLVIENGEELQLNGEDVSGVKGYVTKGTASAGQEEVSAITIEWIADDDLFITSKQSALLPGLDAVQILMGGMTFPESEEITLDNSGGDLIELSVPIEDGDATISLLEGNGTPSASFKTIGKDSSDKLKTGTGTSITLNTTANENYFVASYATSTEGESYYLKVTKVNNNSGIQEVTIKNEVTDNTYVVEKSKDIDFGDVTLTMTNVEEAGATNDGIVTMAINSVGGSFQKLYTKEGMTIYLPVNCAIPTSGACSTGAGVTNWTATPPTSLKIQMREEDKNDGLGLGNEMNASVKLNVDGDVTVDSVTAAWSSGTSLLETGDSTNVYEGYVNSDLATQAIHDQGGDQRTLEVVYHGEESYADVYIAAPSVVSGAAASVLTVTDSEANSVSTKNLIVVGGSCVNTVARQIVDITATAPICGADFTALTGVGAGQYLVQVATSPLASDKIAMLVAGYELADTLKAATYVTAENPSTVIGKVVKTTAEAVVTA